MDRKKRTKSLFTRSACCFSDHLLIFFTIFMWPFFFIWPFFLDLVFTFSISNVLATFWRDGAGSGSTCSQGQFTCILQTVHGNHTCQERIWTLSKPVSVDYCCCVFHVFCCLFFSPHYQDLFSQICNRRHIFPGKNNAPSAQQ